MAEELLIDYKNVNVYQDEKLILENVNLQVGEGEFIYIIGKVGSGKSSLLKTMYCELDVDEADSEQAVVLGRDITDIKRKYIPAMRKQMGIIFQDFQLLHDRTVYRNLRFVLKATGWKNNKEIDERIQQVLSEVGMESKRDKMPHELSGGEQQRIAIARAILNKPRIIIADEPTGNLDPETAANIVRLLMSQRQHGTAVIMSTHNIGLLDQFPGIVYRCKNGRMTNVTGEYHNIDLSRELQSDNEEEETVQDEETEQPDTIAEEPQTEAEAPETAPAEEETATAKPDNVADDEDAASDEAEPTPTDTEE